MTLVVASGEFPAGNVLSFSAFPTAPYLLEFVITFHVEGQVKGEISYRVSKWEHVISQTEPAPFSLPDPVNLQQLRHAASIWVTFPSQGSYSLDLMFDGALLHSFPFSVFNSSERAPLEKEIVYYLKRKRGPRTVPDITRGVYNPKLLNKTTVREFYAKVYFALLRMKEVVNINLQEHGTLEEKMNSSKWKLKD